LLGLKSDGTSVQQFFATQEQRNKMYMQQISNLFLGEQISDLIQVNEEGYNMEAAGIKNSGACSALLVYLPIRSRKQVNRN
jgi:hypothetical protein